MICSDNWHLVDLSDNITFFIFEKLIEASNSYGVVHNYLCLALCAFGCVVNTVHVAVLTRPALRRNAVNRLLGFVAVCDIVTMLSYFVFIFRFGLGVDFDNPPVGYEFYWACFLLAHLVLSILLHTITLYLIVATAYIRYKSINEYGGKWNRQTAAGPLFLCISLCISVLTVPTYLLHSIVKVPTTDVITELYTIRFTDFGLLSHCGLFSFNLWMTGMVFKVVPCALLLLFTIALLRKLKTNDRRRSLIVSPTSSASRKMMAKSDRTTKILVVLLLVFLVTELPQGILAVVNSLFPNDIHQLVYLSFGELLDLLSLVNCNTGAVVYPLMSSQYRVTLRRLWSSRYYRPSITA